MQLFRLMGMPDKMIAFDELPADLLEGLDMHDESRLPRHWKEFIGVREKYIRIPPDRDPLTGGVRMYPPLVQKAPYTYTIDWEINNNKERWQEIHSFVKRNAPKDFRLLDKLEDMARPMSTDVHAEMSLEPEEVVIIPISKEVSPMPATEATVFIDTAVKQEPLTINAPAPAPAPVKVLKIKDPMRTCGQCDREFSTRQVFKNHMKNIHTDEKV